MTRTYIRTDKSTPEYRKWYQRQYYLQHRVKAAAYQREYNRSQKFTTSKRTPPVKYNDATPIAPQVLAHLPVEKVLRIFEKVSQGKMIFCAGRR